MKQNCASSVEKFISKNLVMLALKVVLFHLLLYYGRILTGFFGAQGSKTIIPNKSVKLDCRDLDEV